jgi:hypothetical protein
MLVVELPQIRRPAGSAPKGGKDLSRHPVGAIGTIAALPTSDSAPAIPAPAPERLQW